MTNDKALVERLHDSSDGWSGDAIAVGADVAEEAANLIERQARIIAEKDAEIERLRRVEADYARHEQTLRDNGIKSHSEAVVRVLDAERRALAAEAERDAAVEAEREACARIAVELKMNAFDKFGFGWNHACEVAARDIRSRAAGGGK